MEPTKTGKPERIGTYVVKDASDNIGFAYWSGLVWGNLTRLQDSAWRCRFDVCHDIVSWSKGPLELLTQEAMNHE